MVTLAACGRREVSVRVAIPGPDSLPSPVPGVALVALPYDRDSIIAVLEARAATPRPHTRVLDSLFRAFRQPFTAYAAASYRAQKLRDSLDLLKRHLDSLPRNGTEYRALYLRFGRQADSLTAALKARDRTQTALAAVRRSVIPRIDRLRAEVRAWEDSTRRDYNSITTQLTAALGRDPRGDSTGADGRVTLPLGPGPWWIYAFTWDAADPYAEWYWNVPVQGDSVVLDEHSGQRRPKY